VVVADRVDRARAEPVDDAGFDEPADHDEQTHEEHEGRPLDLLEVDRGRRAGHHDDQSGTEQGHDRGLEVHDGVQAESHCDERQHGQAANQKPAIRDGGARVQSHHCVDAVGVVDERSAEHEPGHDDEQHEQHDDDGSVR
jgi:hypothetical protein